jgi:hypothetical protein
MSQVRNRQRGAALIALLAVILLAASWLLVSRLYATGSDIAAARRARNAVVLNQAKQALIGYVVAQAAKAFEPRPGALPCPEAPGFFDSPTQDGQTASSCSLPKVGRFPWRTIGTDKLVDASGEPLWYVVSPGWAYTSGPGPVINSDTPGQLTVDGVPNSAVALIIAPGPAFGVAAAPGCAAWSQVRPTAGNPDWRNYLECENATSPADAVFVTSGPSASFNDQVLRVTAADLLPGIEAAIANRIEREIVPALKSVYAPPNWGLTGDPVYPFAAPFGNPGPGAGTSSFQGAAGTYQGLLPVNYTNGCDPAAEPRCNTSFVAWDQTPTLQQTGGSADLGNQACTSITTAVATAQCTGQYNNSGTLQVRMTTHARNVAMALRQFDPTQAIAECRLSSSDPWGSCGTTTASATATLDNSGAAAIRVDFMLPSRTDQPFLRITMNIGVLADHALLNPSDSTTGWFVRNEWYRLAYYAVAPGHTANVLPAARSCTTGGTCLSVVNGDPARPITPVGGQRALLILAGRSINGSARPSATLSDYLEFGNASAAYELQRVSTAVDATLKKPFNDRVVVIGTN